MSGFNDIGACLMIQSRFCVDFVTSFDIFYFIFLFLMLNFFFCDNFDKHLILLQIKLSQQGNSVS